MGWLSVGAMLEEEFNLACPGMEDLTPHLMCVDGETGEITRNKRIKPTLPESKRAREHRNARQAPVTDGGHLYVLFGKNGVFKFDLEGNQI